MNKGTRSNDINQLAASILRQTTDADAPAPAKKKAVKRDAKKKKTKP